METHEFDRAVALAGRRQAERLRALGFHADAAELDALFSVPEATDAADDQCEIAACA